MITINKAPGIPVFSKLVERANLQNPSIFVEPTPLGRVIFKGLLNFNRFFPNVKSNEFIIMPDHIHFIINIVNKMDVYLWDVIKNWKSMLFEEALRMRLITGEYGSLFDSGFNDLFLKHSIKFIRLKNYIYNNPYNLWVRYKHPEFFQREKLININGIEFSLYGNTMLLEHPYIFPVVVHRKDLLDTNTLKKKEAIWNYAINNGGVLISYFFSEKEKDILKKAMSRNCKIIYLRNAPLGEREKPKGKFFTHCSNGKLLYLMPEMNGAYPGNRQQRKDCLFLNKIAEDISTWKI